MSQKKSKLGNHQFESHLVEASAESALAAIDEAGELAELLVEKWTQQVNSVAILEVAERGSGPARKAARRALNILRSRGVTPPPRKRVAVIKKDDARSEDAWLMPPDATGIAAVIIGIRARTDRYRVCFVFLGDQAGIRKVENGEMSHSQLKEAFGRLSPRANQKPVSVPLNWARSRIDQARKIHAETGQPEPLGLSTARELLEPVPQEPPPHPFDEEGLELAEEDAKELAVGSSQLHRLPEFASWFPEKSAIEEMLQNIGSTLQPNVEPDPEELQKKIADELQAATDRYFSPQRRDNLLRAMKDSALSVLQREGEQKALEVAATMKVIQTAGLITDPPHAVPFLRGFFEKSLSLLAAQDQGRLRIPIPSSNALPTSEPESVLGGEGEVDLSITETATAELPQDESSE